MNRKNGKRLFSSMGVVLVLLLLFLPGTTVATTDDVKLDPVFYEGLVGIGYRSVTSSEGEPARATEYSLLESSPTAELEFSRWQGHSGFKLTGDYLNESDYTARADVNFRSQVRFHLDIESLYHNLDHRPFGPPVRPDAFKPGATSPWVEFEDRDPGEDYFVEVERSSAQFRAKPGHYPAHVNVNYWRLERTGKEQLRYNNHAGDLGNGGSPCDQCHVRSQTRSVDRVTEEVSGSIDAHLGYVDLIAEQVYREFRDNEPIPSDLFSSPGFARTSAGPWQHDEDPDSRMLATTVKAHTSLSGGVVGAASFTIGKRENQSELTDVEGVESETDFYRGAANFTYTLSPRWTFDFRFRYLDLDNENSDRIVSLSEGPTPIDVPDNVDLTRETYAARVSYRPSRHWTFKGDFDHKKIKRGNSGQDFTGYWNLPEEEEINRLRLSALGRMLDRNSFKVTSWLEYQTSDDPAYGASAEEAQRAFLGLTWTPAPTLGFNLNLRGAREQNLDKNFEVAGSLFEEDRRHEQSDATFGVWWNPLESLGITLNYGYLRGETEQDLIFSTHPNFFIQDEDLEYTQRVNTATAGIAWRIGKLMEARIDGRYNDSYSAWDPDFNVSAPVPVDSDGLKEVSRIDLRQYGVTVGVDWSPLEDWQWSAQYSYDDYDDRDSDFFDGSAQTVMASVSRVW